MFGARTVWIPLMSMLLLVVATACGGGGGAVPTGAAATGGTLTVAAAVDRGLFEGASRLKKMRSKDL